MRYSYTDTFIVDSITKEELQKHEDNAVKEISDMNIEDDYYFKELVICRVYMFASREQIESDGMKEKYKVYKEEFDRLLKLAIATKNANDDSITTINSGIGNILLERG